MKPMLLNGITNISPPGHAFKRDDGDAMVEFHVDDCDAFDSWRVNDETSPYARHAMDKVGDFPLGGELKRPLSRWRKTADPHW